MATSPSTYFKVLKKINSPQLFSFSQLIFHFIPLFTKAGISLLPLLCFSTMEYLWAVDIWSNWQFFKQNSTRGWQNVYFCFRKFNIATYGQALFLWHIRYQELTIWKQWASFSFSSAGNTVNVKPVGTGLRSGLKSWRLWICFALCMCLIFLAEWSSEAAMDIAVRL